MTRGKVYRRERGGRREMSWTGDRRPGTEEAHAPKYLLTIVFVCVSFILESR